ncbi:MULTISPECIES: Bax inhibitor-1/YccA family protein [unclassified Lactococcus]|uniref:Bax inhibitor-1/YccA family protein n=1 Tax=unclassified Lactococcus TaxID=2643510 RepID=UPI0011C87D45|nr:MULTISPECIES: Bax inhibitor-1/YccA family protein [unclassified Lactococcus]MQW22451.1 BAX inhibitor (BI)-1/YccA family protein [Lactococcus sp. dk101]TXK45480.1 Bax inhibitor-1/YccA family protein [Lactococcus sp. dk310]TXK51813.1 Bax inhibitor-1/YccA family protein [Lactococcus sp. dk322]
MNNNDNLIFDERKDGLNAFFSKVYGLMGVGVLISGLVSFIMLRFYTNNLVNMIEGSGSFVFLLLWLIPLFMVVPMQRSAMKNSSAALPLFIVYSAFMGFLISFTLLMYTATDITLAFVTAVAMFFGLAVYGRTTKRDLSAWHKALFAGVIGLIVIGILNFFIQSSGLMLFASFVGVVIFSGLIAYDNQKIEQVYYQMGDTNGWAISMALSLYLDFLNLFLFLLRIFGFAGNRD